MLHGLEEPQRRFDLVAAVEEGILIFRHQVGKDLLEELDIARIEERQAGQREAGFAHAADLVPGKARADAGEFALVGEQLIGSRLEAVVVIVARHPPSRLAGELRLEILR